ncbi:hypothetical protein AGMMS49992_29300 [Clostridia bacterium]|nr:hypothetical protein AGMMS49992_29300 [Clostridia bacterium]
MQRITTESYAYELIDQAARLELSRVEYRAMKRECQPPGLWSSNTIIDNAISRINHKRGRIRGLAIALGIADNPLEWEHMIMEHEADQIAKVLGLDDPGLSGRPAGRRYRVCKATF